MKKYITFLIFIPLICFIASGCNKKTSDKEINHIEASELIGVWSMEVQNGNLIGNEEINLLPLNNLMVKDSLIFSGEDSGFSFMLPILVKLEGSWNLEKDSLFIKYKSESINIKLNEKDFVLSNNQENADQKVFETLKKEMGDKLFDYVNSFLNDSYHGVADKELFFGEIIYQKADTLLLRLNDSQFYMTR